MVELAKDLVAYSWFYTTPHPLVQLTERIPIFFYHSVADHADPFFPAMPSAFFEEQIRFFAKFYHIISLEKLGEMLQSGTVPKQTIVLTIDDGYGDNYSMAWPILKKYGATATIFLTTGSIGTEVPLWTDELALRIKKTPVPRIELFDLIPDRVFSLHSPAEKLVALREFKEALKRVPDEKRKSCLNSIRELLGRVDCSELRERMLTWDSIRHLSSEGMDFGSHTVTHPILSRTSQEKVREELTYSKATIEDQLQRPVTTLAYPNGSIEDFSEGTEAIAREIGYRFACSSIEGMNGADVDLYALRRIYTNDRSLPRFMLRLKHTNESGSLPGTPFVHEY